MTTRGLLLLLLAFAGTGARAAQPSATGTPPPTENAPVVAPPTVAPASSAPPAAAGGRKSRLPDPKSVPPPPLSPRFQQVRDRIDELFRHRQEEPPVTDPRSNPFRPAGAPLAPPRTATPRTPEGSPAPAPSASESDLQLLQQAAATLKVAGSINIRGVDHLSINQTAYKEGDVIHTKVKGQTVLIRVKNISRFSYTLSLNGTELSVKY